MVLYKYFPAGRIDVLQNRLIRFTQPTALDDSFEALPHFSAIATKEGFARIFADAIRQQPAYWEFYRRSSMTNLDRQALADKIEGNLDYAEQLHEDAGLPDPFLTLETERIICAKVLVSYRFRRRRTIS